MSLPPEQAKADLEDFMKYLRWQREFARQSWDWHLFSTKLLMYVVMAIVAFGLLITYLQFTRDGRKLRRIRKRKAAADKPEEAEEAAFDDASPSTLKLGLEGIEITSQVIGLLVLAFSLAFFYLYVKVVYPMQEVELQKQAQSASESPSRGDGTSRK